MSVRETNFKHVSYLWDDAKAAALAGDEVALLIYRSNLLVADFRLANYGGVNHNLWIGLTNNPGANTFVWSSGLANRACSSASTKLPSRPDRRFR